MKQDHFLTGFDAAKPLDSVDLLARSRCARRSVFESVRDAFARSDALDESHGVQASVWSTAEVFIGARTTIDLARGVFEIVWRAPVLRLSVAVRLGETRIGLIVPKYKGMHVDFLGEFDEYPSGGRGCERIVRELGDAYVLFDYVFSGQRFGEDMLTARALSGDLDALQLLTDAIFHEARHLRAGVVHRIHESGLLRGEISATGVEVVETLDMPLEIESPLSLEEVARRTGLESRAVIQVGQTRSGLSRFIVLVPEARAADVFQALADETLALAPAP